MADIKLTPELLQAQSAEMTSLQTEFNDLFTKVTGALNGMNDSWSENLASNFAGKITAAQKTFTSVSNMLGNGALAAGKSAASLGTPENMLTLLGGAFDKAVPDSLKEMFTEGTISLKENGGILTEKEKQELIDILPPDLKNSAKNASDATEWLAQNYEKIPQKERELLEDILPGKLKKGVSIASDVLRGKADMGTVEKAASLVSGSSLTGRVFRSVAEATYSGENDETFNIAYNRALEESAAAWKNGDVGGGIAGLGKAMGVQTVRGGRIFADSFTNLAGHGLNDVGSALGGAGDTISHAFSGTPVGTIVGKGIKAVGNYLENAGNWWRNLL